MSELDRRFFEQSVVRPDPLVPDIVRPDLKPPVPVKLSTGLDRRNFSWMLLAVGASLAGCGGAAVAVSQVAELLNPSGPSVADVVAHELAAGLDGALPREQKLRVRELAADLDLQGFGCLETVRDEPWPDGTIKHTHSLDCPLQGGGGVWATFSSPEVSSK